MMKRILSVTLSALLLLAAIPMLPMTAKVIAAPTIASPLTVDKVINDFDSVPNSGTVAVGDYTVNVGIGSNTNDPTTTDYSAYQGNDSNVLTIENGVLKSTLSATNLFSLRTFISPKSLTRGNAMPTADTVALQLHVDFTGITSVEAGTKISFEPKIYLSTGRSSGTWAYCIPDETFNYIPDATVDNPSPSMEIHTTGGGVQVYHGSVWGYAGQSGTIIIPFDAWTTERLSQFGGSTDVWNLYKYTASNDYNRNYLLFETYGKKYAAGDVFAIDDICWMKKTPATAQTEKTVVIEDFTSFTPTFSWNYATGNYSAYSNTPDTAVTANEISINDGRFTVTPNDTAVDGVRFTTDIETDLWKEEYNSFKFDIDISETTGTKRLRFYFYGYGGQDGTTKLGIYNTSITLTHENGSIETLTLDETSDADTGWFLPEGFKGTITVPKSGVHTVSGSGSITGDFEELCLSIETLGWLTSDKGASFYLDNMLYCSTAETLDDDTGTDFSAKESPLYETASPVTEDVHTVEAFFKTESNFTQGILGTKYGHSYNGYNASLSVTATGQLVARFGETEFCVSNVTLNDGLWHHVATVADETAGKFYCYVDGALVETLELGTLNYTKHIDYLPLTVGHIMPAESMFYNVFDGSIANVRVWSDARTEEEITANAAASVGADAEGLVAEWMLDGDTFTAETKGKYGLKNYHLNVDSTNELFAQYNRDAAEDEFNIIFLPDTQTIIKNFGDQVPDIFNWIIANADRLNIKAVVSLGDIVEHGDTESEHQSLSEQYNRLTAAEIPWIPTPGDHDYDFFGDRTSTLYDTYFKEEMLYENSEFQLGGLYDESTLLNGYYYLTPNADTKYVILALEPQPRDEVIEWANEIVTAHPDYRVIVATHKYMERPSASRFTTVSYNNGNHGETLWQRFLSQHKNIDMVICGHAETSGYYHSYDEGINGNQVLQVGCDLQNTDQSYKTVGAVLMGRFKGDGSSVSFNLYSAHHNLFIDSDCNDLSFDLGTSDDKLDKPLADGYYGGSDFKVLASKDANSFPAVPNGYLDATADYGAATNPEHYGTAGGNVTYEWDSETESGKYTATADCNASGQIFAYLKNRPDTQSNMLSFHLDATGVTSGSGTIPASIAITVYRDSHTVKANSYIYFKADGSDEIEEIYIPKSVAADSSWYHKIPLKAGVSGTYYIPATSFDPTTAEESGYDAAWNGSGKVWTYFSELADSTVFKAWYTDARNATYTRLYLSDVTLSADDVLYIDDVSYVYALSYLKEMNVTAEGFSGNRDGAAHSITVNAPEGSTVKYGTEEGVYDLETAPTFTEAGSYTVYYEVSKGGYKTVTGSATVEIIAAPLDVTDVRVTLSENISLEYKLDGDKLAGYEGIRAEFTTDSLSAVVTEYTTDENGDIIFSFNGLNPKNAGDSVTAVYYGTKDGVEEISETYQYSIAEYCRDVIETYSDTNEDYEEVIAVCKGLLNYAAASQTYFDYNPEGLVNEGYENYTAGRTYQNAMALTANEGENKVTFKSAGLSFTDTVLIRFNVAAESTKGLYTVVSDGENTWRINSFKATGTAGRYYVYIDGINLTDLSKPLTFTVYDANDNQVSDTLTYSVESYAAAKQGAGGAIENLVNAMMNYGDAVRALAESK